MYATIKLGGAIRQQRCRLDPNLKGDIAFLSSLLKTEFVFSAGGLDRNIHETLQGLVDSDVLCLEAEAGEPGQVCIKSIS